MMAMTAAQCMDLLIEAGLYLSGALYDSETAVTSVTYDSKEATDGTLFFCKGAAFKTEYLMEAVRRGAVCYVSETAYPEALCSYLIVSDVRRAMAVLGAAFYGHADRALDLIGITGTKGKSTTAYYIKYILDEYAAQNGEKPCGIVSSIDTYDGKIFEESHLTTPEALVLHHHFANARDCGISRFVMEVSSQALKYDRVLGVSYRSGVFLNISEDHISPVEHRDFEDYFSSKLKLFAQSETAYINTDCDFAARIAEAAGASGRVVTFGQNEQADFYGYNVRKEEGEIRFRVRCAQFDVPFALTMPGLFNVENALAAIAVGRDMGGDPSVISAALEHLVVPGRADVMDGAGLKVFINYMHNGISCQAVLKALKKDYPGKFVTVVIGVAGQRSPARIQGVGEACGKYADRVFFSADDPDLEDPRDIDIRLAHAAADGKAEIIIEPDRTIAVERALREAPVGSVVVLGGKGSEDTQRVNGEYVYYESDPAIAKRILAELEKQR